MNKIKYYINKILESFDTKAVKVGTYSLSSTILVLAILIVVNMMFSSLPSQYTQYDMSSAKLYSLTSQTKSIVSNLEENVTIYWIVQTGEEDHVIEKLLEKYDDLSEYITVVKKDPDAYPTFMNKYTTSSYENNCLVVESDDKYRYIDYYDIYETTSSYYSTSESFDGEGRITSAIDYVINDDFPTVYVINGHGEQELSSSILETIDLENILVENVSLINMTEISHDIDCIIINGPESDISNEEKIMIEKYLNNGGNLIVMAGPSEKELTNLESILENYGVSSEPGIVIESNQYYYAYGYSFILLPDIESHDITDNIISNNYYILSPVSKGYTINELDENLIEENNIEVTSLLTSSNESYSKIDGLNITTYDYEENDIKGPFSLALSITKDDSHIIWFGSSVLIDETYDSYSSGANSDLFMNSLTYAIGEENTVSIYSKSLDYEYLVIDSTTSSNLKTLLIAVIPFTYLGIGLIVLIKRRQKA